MNSEIGKVSYIEILSFNLFTLVVWYETPRAVRKPSIFKCEQFVTKFDGV